MKPSDMPQRKRIVQGRYASLVRKWSGKEWHESTK